ncbi:Ferrichrome-iron receptor (fragment) [Hyella patelloides LEGE 07179]|uniref:Ferrichrome-iron receptor n=1 Tax=Hyella patelloides LEGE 07179 TaxID=945734 RepID=A0A563VYD9_9CYAN
MDKLCFCYSSVSESDKRGLIRPSIDLSGPLTPDGKLLYRLNAVYQSGDEIQDYDNDLDRFFFSPVISWQIGDRTNLTIELEYLDDERPASFGVPAFGDGIANIPLEQISNEPDDLIEQEYFNVGYDLEHRFSDSWKLRHGFRYTNEDTTLDTAIPLALNEETGILGRFWTRQAVANEVFTLQTNVVGEFATGSIEHQLLFGVDLNRTNQDTINRIDLLNPLPLNIFAPVYEAFPRPEDFGELLLNSDEETETDRLGIYIQDQISFSDNLILLAGFRYDTVEQRLTGEQTAFFPDGADESQNDDGFSPRVGIVYKPIEEVSLYTSYSRSFAPNRLTSNVSDFFDPEVGEGFEVGVKTDLLNGKLVATLAYFDITKQNVVTEDPFVIGASIATGEQQSRGVELDTVGEILPGWNIIASYAFIDAEVSEDNIIEVGNQLNGVPQHSANLWTTYEIQSGDLQGLGFGLGFDFVGEREGDLENTFKLDSYFLTNAAIFYQGNNWRTAVNFRNLFDVDYIAGATATRERSNDPGEPFTVVGSFSIEF